MCGINKKGQESPVKEHNCEFLPLTFFKFRASRMLQPPKQQFLVEEKVFCFAKRALHAGTARNKWLK